MPDEEILEDGAEQNEDENEENEETETSSVISAKTESSRIARVPKLSVQRYKGLGEMNAKELWDTTMNPDKRVLKQVTIENAVEADKIFDILMGNEVAPRKSFIQNNARLAKLDI